MLRIAAALALLLATPAGAAPILDIEVLPTGGFFIVDNDAQGVQTFVAGSSGLLTRIDVFVVDDWETAWDTGMALNLGPIYAASFQSASQQRITSTWISFVFFSPIAVSAGEVLSFDVEHDNIIQWAAGNYASGVSWYCAIDGCTDPHDPLTGGTTTLPEIGEFTAISLPESYAFRTYIAPATPEPSAAALLAVGGAAALWRARRARR